MTILENRSVDIGAGRLDDQTQAQAFLFADSVTSAEAPGVVISLVDPSHSDGVLHIDSRTRPADGSGGVSLPDGLANVVTDLPFLDGWIVDLSLRDERITVVTRTDVLCSALLVSLPEGWIATVAALGALTVVLRCDSGGATVGHARVPARVVREPGLLAARIPVCLS